MCTQPSFNLCTGVVVDVMHCVFLGVMEKTLMGFWFGSDYRGSPYNIKAKVVVILCIHMALQFKQPLQIPQCDEKLMQIHVPAEFSRPVRSLQDLIHWKGIANTVYSTTDFTFVYQTCSIRV